MPGAANTHDRPNIVMIMADQLVAALTGAYGNPSVHTPSLDRLAREGVRFDAAYSPCPVCVPARASMMTGRYVSRIGVYDNGAPLACDQPTFAHYLAAAGYDTALAGKMHFVGPDQLHGFHRRFNTNLYPADFRWTEVRDPENPVEKRHVLQYLGENIRVGGWNQFLSFDEETQLRGTEYLRAQAVQQRLDRESGVPVQPFFLCLSYHHPHEPFEPPQELWDLYDRTPIDLPELEWLSEDSYSELDRWLNRYHGVVGREASLCRTESLRRLRRAYCALVTYVDRKVGEVLTVLDEQRLTDNTVVLFTSDHGDMLGERAMVQKRTFYEYSSKVPLLIRFPDGRQAGTASSVPAGLVDIFPTLLELAGIVAETGTSGVESRDAADHRHVRELDGTSLLSILESPERYADRCVFSEYHSLGAYAPCFMVRDARYKYVCVHGYGTQLFDMQNDPGERVNLAGRPESSEAAERLHRALLGRFDPDRIDRDVEASIARRLAMKEAMKRADVTWDYAPQFDPKKGVMDHYLPRSETSTIPR